MTQEIEGWKRLCNAWKHDCQHYESGLKAIRSMAKEDASTADIIEQINFILQVIK